MGQFRPSTTAWNYQYYRDTERTPGKKKTVQKTRTWVKVILKIGTFRLKGHCTGDLAVLWYKLRKYLTKKLWWMAVTAIHYSYWYTDITDIHLLKNNIHSFFFIRILFFRPKLNIPIFLPMLGWKYSCNILNYSLWYSTNRRQFSMVYSLTDQKMTSKKFKTQVEPQATGEWFHCQVFDILWRHFMVYKSIDHRKLLSISLLQ